MESDEFCITCKANLTQDQPHSESCKFLQNAEAEKKKLKEESDLAIQKAQEEFEKTLAIQKEKITHEAREKILNEIAQEKAKIKELKIQKENQIKSSFINKILQFDSQKQITTEELEKMNLNDLMKYYEKIIKIHVAEKKMKFIVSCPKCNISLGQTMTQEDAINLQKLHRKECPKYKSGYAKWILIGITFMILSGVAVSFAKSNPQLFKNGEKKDE